MTPRGEFRQANVPIAWKIGGAAMLVAVVAGAVSLAALVLWVALALIPVAIVAGLIGWVALRFNLGRGGANRTSPSRRTESRMGRRPPF